jgi:hypothetical protein
MALQWKSERLRIVVLGGISLRLVSFVVLSLVTQVAFSEPSSDAERAQQLFDEGRALMKRGKYSQGCDKLEESQALDPAGGTVLNLGICRQLEGRTATAYSVLSKAMAQAHESHRADRVATAERHLKELANVLSRLTVRLPQDSSANTMGVEIDGIPIAREFLGQPLPLDPGVHEVRASQNGRVPWSIHITLAPVADEQTVELPVLVPESVAPPEVLPPPQLTPILAPKEVQPATVVPTRPTNENERSYRWFGYTLTGVGGAALAVGSYFGVRALILRSHSDRYFDGKYCTIKSCVDDWNNAKTSSAVANVALGFGILSAGVGTYLLLRPTPKDRHASGVTLSLELGNSAAVAVGTGQF